MTAPAMTKYPGPIHPSQPPSDNCWASSSAAGHYARGWHGGSDLRPTVADRVGDPVNPAYTGYVLWVANYYGGWGQDYGRQVLVQHHYAHRHQGMARAHDHMWWTFYAHLNRILVSKGQYVRGNTNLGPMGRSGRVTGVHTHFQLHLTSDWREGVIDPHDRLAIVLHAEQQAYARRHAA